ncbi:hypothetical protein [Kordiimonas sp.]|uniref:hypothetical protein n=1 Tax=Kordiimonas sp. TaxID=1970157 RepID=UPI003A8F4B87
MKKPAFLEPWFSTQRARALTASIILCTGLPATAAAALETQTTISSATSAQQTGPKNTTNKSAGKKTAEKEDDDEKSKAESFQENLETAKEAYEKVGAEILDGNYGKALDGAADMAKDKLIEKAEDALKKKNENLYKAYKHGKDIKDDVLKGDYLAAWDKTKDAAYDEAKDYVQDKVIEKVIPGYGQLKGAWDAGYATGELVGQIPISADGRTVNSMAEAQMRQKFFGAQDHATSKQEAYNEIILALVASVKKGEYKLPDYMTFSDAREIIQENIDGDRPVFEGFKAWAANELRDEDVVGPVAAPPASPAVTPETLPATLATHTPPDTTPGATPDATPAPHPEPVEEDPWALDPAPRQVMPAAENSEFPSQQAAQPPAQPSAQPEEDIWATDDPGDSDFVEAERYRLQQQLEAEKEHARAIADSASYQKFAAAEAEREEEARRKAEKSRKLREGMNALAQGLGQIAQQIQHAQQGGTPPQATSGSTSASGKRTYTAAEKAAAIYQACVQRTGDQKGCRSMAGTGAKLDNDLSQGKIPMDFIKKLCRDAADSNKNYERCVSDKVAEMKRRMGQ